MRRCGDGTTLPNAIATVVGAAARGLIPRNTVLPPPFRGSGRAVRVATGLTQESTNRASFVRNASVIGTTGTTARSACAARRYVDCQEVRGQGVGDQASGKCLILKV